MNNKMTDKVCSGAGSGRGSGQAPRGVRAGPHLAIIVGSYSAEINQLIERIRGDHQKCDLEWVQRAIRINSTKRTTILLQMHPFEVENETDSTVFRGIAYDLERYVKANPDQTVGCSISGHYLHPNQQQDLSIAAHRNIRALEKLLTKFGCTIFFVTSTSSAGSQETPTSLRTASTSISPIPLSSKQAGPLSSPPQKIGFIRDILSRHFSDLLRVPQDFTSQYIDEILCHAELPDPDYLHLVQQERARLAETVDCMQGMHRDAIEKIQTITEKETRTSENYKSLLLELGLSDNTEVKGLLNQFINLNDTIDEISVELAGQVKEFFGRHPGRSIFEDPVGLRVQLQQLNEPLLALPLDLSPDGIERFVDLYTGSTLCFCLSRYIFDPFYPSSSNSSSGATRSDDFKKVYENRRLLDSPILSVKWRVDTYKSLCQFDKSRDQRAKTISSHAASRINKALSSFFGDSATLEMADPNLIKLVNLFQRALDLNHQLKAEVTHGGDFDVIYFPSNAPFDGSTMSVRDSEDGDPTPNRIVSTCKLGVRITKAVGGGVEPESSISLKAEVATEKEYE